MMTSVEAFVGFRVGGLLSYFLLAFRIAFLGGSISGTIRSQETLELYAKAACFKDTFILYDIL